MKNDEIIKKQGVKIYQNKRYYLLIKDFEEYKRRLGIGEPINYIELNEMLEKARSDTTKQIFEELDNFIVEHDNGNSKNLEDFILQSLEYSDKDEVEIAKEDYLTLKNKYKVDLMEKNDEKIPIEEALKEIRDGLYLKTDCWENDEVAKIVEMYYNKARSDAITEVFTAIMDLEDKLINPDYYDLKAVIEAVKKKYKVD